MSSFLLGVGIGLIGCVLTRRRGQDEERQYRERLRLSSDESLLRDYEDELPFNGGWLAPERRALIVEELETRRRRRLAEPRERARAAE